MSNPNLTPEAKMGVICKVCKGNMFEVSGCDPSVLMHDNKQYSRIKVGDAGDFYEGGNAPRHSST